MGSVAPLPLPEGITSRQIGTEAGLDMHVLEAGSSDRPLILLLHGFPELAYSWRRVMPALAEAGYWVVAPDQRGYGRTTGWDADYDGDLSAFALPNMVRDAVALVRALGRDHVDCLVGHDYGSFVTAWAALIRPDVFRRAVLMSAPFGGPPAIAMRDDPVHADLAALDRPRKHYQWYYATREAAAEMDNPLQGLHAFLRAYFHMKSADWAENRPHTLTGWTAGELARMPTYYIMDLGSDMPASVAGAMPTAAEIAACDWLPEEALAIYTGEYARTGFQGGLQHYRCATGPRFQRDLSVYSGRRIEVPVCFISGASDWGYRQKPGAFERMESEACADYHGSFLVPGAGHWVQQEQPQAVVGRILEFLP
jgi:pimeloyl-ACP methyl ester carboxylesterase